MRTRKRKPEATGAPAVTPAVTPAEWEAARTAWLAGAGIAGILEAVPSLDKQGALALVHVGDRRRGMRPLQEEAREAASRSDSLERKMRGAVERIDEEEAARLLELRAKRALEAEKATKAVLDDAGQAKAEELRLVRTNRLGTMALAQSNARLLRVVGALSRGLFEDLVQEGPDGDHLAPAAYELSHRERVGLIRTIAQVVQRTAEASARAVQMERLLAGEPTAILAHQVSPAEDMSPEDALRWIGLAARVHARKSSPHATHVVEASGEALPPPDDRH
jgi:hypothetical protein